jgi:hypothetical protein
VSAVERLASAPLAADPMNGSPVVELLSGPVPAFLSEDGALVAPAPCGKVLELSDIRYSFKLSLRAAGDRDRPA